MCRIEVVTSVLKENNLTADQIRERLTARNAVAFNLMSSPGSGKTTLLEKTIAALAPKQVAVLVGDLQTSRDAERLSRFTNQTVQINTGRGCHLHADQVSAGLAKLEGAAEIVFIENVGNMVCPSAYDLGEHKRIALLSVPEGDDKVAKYPTLFQSVDLVLLTKCDLMELLDFDIERVLQDLAQVNSEVPILCVSAKTGEGMDVWLDWLNKQSNRTESAAREPEHTNA